MEDKKIIDEQARKEKEDRWKEVKDDPIVAPVTLPADIIFHKLSTFLAKRKVEKLLGKSQEEAEKINEEYEQLKQKVQDDMAALKAFERDKLGRTGKEQEEF